MTLNDVFEKRKQDLYFIELSRDIEIAGFTISAGTELPIFESDVSLNSSDTNFDIKAIIKNMCILNALDEDFPYNSDYLNIIENIVLSKYKFIMNDGSYAAMNKEYCDAILIFKFGEKHIDDKSERADVIFSLGKTYYSYYENRKQFDKVLSDELLELSIASFMRSYELNQKPEVLYYLAVIHFNSSNFTSADNLAKRALKEGLSGEYKVDLLSKINKFEDLKSLEQATLFIEQERYNQALEELYSVSEEFEDSFEIQYFLGLCKRKLGLSTGAIENIKRALELNPASAEVYAEVAALSMIIQDYKKAKEAITEGVKLNPNSIHLTEVMIEYYRNLNQEENMQACIKKLEEISQSDELI